MTPFTGIPNKTVVSRFETLTSQLERIFEVSDLVEKEIPQEVSLVLLNLVLGIYVTLGINSQLASRTGRATLDALTQVVNCFQSKEISSTETLARVLVSKFGGEALELIEMSTLLNESVPAERHWFQPSLATFELVMNDIERPHHIRFKSMENN